MARQIGIFFLYLGLIISVIAAISLQAKAPAAPTCVAGMILVSLGLFMIWRNRSDVPPSVRFKTLKKMREKKK